MADHSRSILLLAGRIGAFDHFGSLTSLLDRLGRQGVSAQVLCLSAGAGAGCDYRIVECPALAKGWRQSLAIRKLRPGEGLRLPDLLHALHSCMGPVALALAERWRVPYLQSVDEYLAPDERLRVSARWCRGLVAASRELADGLSRQLGVPPDYLAVVRHGVEIADDDAAPSSVRRVPVIGTAGPLAESSGFMSFLNAARRVLDAGVDAEFVIAGQGEGEVELRRRAERLRITDRVTFADVAVIGRRFWNVLDVYCQTSIVPTVGRTLATALAFGVPSVASDVEGLRSLVIHGKTGLRVPPDHSGNLADAILSLLNDREQASRLGREGRERVRAEFNPETEAESLATVYERAHRGGIVELSMPVTARPCLA